MSIEENKNLIKRFIEEVQTEHNFDVLEEIMSPGMIDHYYDSIGLPQPPNAIEAFKHFYSELLQAFPDLHPVVYDIIGEADKVVTYKSFRGTHLGKFRNFSPTDKKISGDVIDIFRIANGKLVEHWVVADWLSFMEQLRSNS